MTPHLTTAIDMIDAELGTGYAIEHPELIAAYIIAAAIDGITVMIENNGLAINDISTAISEAVDADKEKRRTARGIAA